MFQFYKIEFEDYKKKDVSDWFDERSLAQSNLKVMDDGTLVSLDSSNTQVPLVQAEGFGCMEIL